MSRHYAVLARSLHGLCFLTIGVALTPDSSLLRASDRAVEFVWTATTGEGQTGSNTIEAENGDVLTMTVYLSTEGDQGIMCYGVSVLFDIFANDEFDIVDVRGISDTLPPMGTTNPGGFIESSPTSTGVIQTINGGTLSGGVFNETFPIAEIDLVPVAIATNGPDFLAFDRAGFDGFCLADPLGFTTDGDWGLATVNELRPRFRRGDVDDDAVVTISDVVFQLDYLFRGGPRPACFAAADTNGDGSIDVSDPTYLLLYLFVGSLAPPAPFPDCGGTPADESAESSAFMCDVDQPSCVAAD